MNDRPRAILLFYFLMLALASPSVFAQAKEPFHPDWLARDVQVAEILKKALVPTKDNAKELVSALQASQVDEDREIGFGGHRWYLATYGGYASCWSNIVSFNNRLALVDVQCPFKENWPLVKKQILQVWGGLAKVTSDGIAYRYSNPQALADLKKSVEAGLGNKPVPGNLGAYRESVDTLNAPQEKFDFGERCYFAAESPKGRSAITTLVEAKQWDLIRALLSSPNPEGRVYAAEALLNYSKGGGNLTKEDKASIEAIRSLKIPINTCGGCIVSERLSGELL